MSQTNRFVGKTALITGGAGEIGFATAKALAEEGALIALMDINGEKCTSAADRLSGICKTVRTYICDVGNSAAVEAHVRQIVTDFGSLDLLFNNAGFQGAFKPIHEYPVDDFETVIRINLIGAFNVLRSVSDVMVAQGGGCIVNTASMAGVDGPPNMAAYGASKFALIGLTGTAAKDLAPYGIRVNAISPAFMGPGFMWDRQVQLQAEANTQYFSTDPKVVAEQMIGSVPMHRYGDISEIPGVVTFLMSEDSSYITGVNIPISGGIR